MAAEIGNKQAEKWTKEETLSMLALIEAEAEKTDCLWLGSALVKVKLYKDIWAYWKEKFKDEEDVFRTIKRVEQIFEDRLYTGSTKGTLNATMAIFGLKNNHDWKDKQEIAQTNQNYNTDLTATEAKEIQKGLDAKY